MMMEIKKKKKKGDLLFWNEISRMALLQVGSCCFCCSFYCWASLNLNSTEENTCPPGRELIFFLLLFFSFPFFLPSLFMERSRSKKEITRQLVRREREIIRGQPLMTARGAPVSSFQILISRARQSLLNSLFQSHLNRIDRKTRFPPTGNSIASFHFISFEEDERERIKWLCH